MTSPGARGGARGTSGQVRKAVDRGRSAPRVIVAGAIANKLANGGEAWVRLSWALGFRKLGCDVMLVEQIDPGACVGEDGEPAPFETSANLDYFRRVTRRFGFEGRAALIRGDGEGIAGLAMSTLLALAEGADLLVNISGHLRFEPILGATERTAFVDIDPGFTQYWHSADEPGGRIPEHDFYFTIGENIGTEDCPIPTCGIDWRATRQPVVLDLWPVRQHRFDRFTTVANWRGPYGAIGGRGGLKVHEFRKFIALPSRAPHAFELALAIHPAESADLEKLHHNGWRTVDPVVASSDPDAFRRYIQRSGAEFSVAQGVYVDSACGWFSDRSVRYLASGKPVLVQETGFSRNLPVGEGLLSFACLDDAIAGAERIVSEYEAQCRAARAVAEEYFDSDRVLGRFLEETGVAA